MPHMFTYLRHIPEGAETAVLVALATPALMVAIRLLVGGRWARCFATALVLFTYSSAVGIPLLVFGSRLVGPIALALCPPVLLVVALISVGPAIDAPAARRIWTAAVSALVLTAFGFVILVLPELRASLRPQEYKDYRLCREHLLTIGKAFTAYAADHKNLFPRQEDALAALTAKRPQPAGEESSYLADRAALRCPAAGRVPLPVEVPPSRMLGDYVYAQPARGDPPDTYILRCRRHTRVRRFWSEQVGLFLRKDGRVDVIPIGPPQPSATKRR